jgi:hypothetical protein
MQTAIRNPYTGLSKSELEAKLDDMLRRQFEHTANLRINFARYAARKAELIEDALIALELSA